MNLYIGNLSPLVTEGDLAVIFDGWGHILFSRLATSDTETNARGYAFITVSNEKQAWLAVQTMNGKYLKGLRLLVRPVVDRAREARAFKAQARIQPALDRIAHTLRGVNGGPSADDVGPCA